MASLAKKEKHRLRKKRKQKGHSKYTKKGEVAPRIAAMFKPKKEKP